MPEKTRRDIILGMADFVSRDRDKRDKYYRQEVLGETFEEEEDGEEPEVEWDEEDWEGWEGEDDFDESQVIDIPFDEEKSDTGPKKN
eukprot:CAMPEP_0113947404 /NCGR_PEP_ID=MMETSP1339-20121228/64532_1 /TAXON_ID=94617 /ORGANISM="Fibrocapsa japonica" /LENGTH=86 /DNA_ID=CAMNT_0000953985 /DNA_START=34 /DNA_END=294 /DNA_ORIENTATION=+ /assembly_acc=CAM_ASM_000762